MTESISFWREGNRVTAIFMGGGSKKVVSIWYDEKGNVKNIFPGDAASQVNLRFGD